MQSPYFSNLAILHACKTTTFSILAILHGLQSAPFSILAVLHGVQSAPFSILAVLHGVQSAPFRWGVLAHLGDTTTKRTIYICPVRAKSSAVRPEVAPTGQLDKMIRSNLFHFETFT